jgi:hypothetical protein
VFSSRSLAPQPHRYPNSARAATQSTTLRARDEDDQSASARIMDSYAKTLPRVYSTYGATELLWRLMVHDKTASNRSNLGKCASPYRFSTSAVRPPTGPRRFDCSAALAEALVPETLPRCVARITRWAEQRIATTRNRSKGFGASTQS